MHILIVEDDENLRLGLQDNLEDEGYDVTVAATIQAARDALTSPAPIDLVILDIMLPDGDGYTLCAERRAKGDVTPVLMLTARTLEDDLLRGFDAGADDYLAKPYRLRELLARVRALLRRKAAAPVSNTLLRFAGFTLNPAARTLTSPLGVTPTLTRTEFDLLEFFLRNRGRALSRDEILDEVWGEDVIVAPRTIDNFVSSLKKKLGWTRRAGFDMTSVRGVGYRFEVKNDKKT